MAIFRCNKCGHIREVGSDYIGKRTTYRSHLYHEHKK